MCGWAVKRYYAALTSEDIIHECILMTSPKIIAMQPDKLLHRPQTLVNFAHNAFTALCNVAQTKVTPKMLLQHNLVTMVKLYVQVQSCLMSTETTFFFKLLFLRTRTGSPGWPSGLSHSP